MPSHAGRVFRELVQIITGSRFDLNVDPAINHTNSRDREWTGLSRLEEQWGGSMACLATYSPTFNLE